MLNSKGFGRKRLLLTHTISRRLPVGLVEKLSYEKFVFTPLILRGMVTFTPRPFYPPGKEPLLLIA
jgi:hypothetical protein